MIKKLAHACVVVSDLEATERFYCDVLGLRVQHEVLRGGRRIGMYVKVAEGNFIEFGEREIGEVDRDVQRIKHLAFEVEDIDDMEKRLQAKGVETRRKKMGFDGAWQMWVADPDGMEIEFQQYTEKSSQITGANVIR